MRRGVVLLTGISLVVALAVPASADRPTEEVSDFFVFQCQLFGEGGEGFVFIEIGDEFAFADASIWLPGSVPFEEEPDLVSDFELSEASIVGDQVTATMPMVFTDTGDPDGTLNLTGTIGDQIGQETFSDRFREGNRWVEIDETITFFEATATIDLDGSQFETQCSADHIHSVVFSTNPHAFRVDFDDAFVECFGIVGSDDSMLNMFAGEFGNEGFLDLQIFAPGDNPEEDPPELFGFAEIGSLTGVIDVAVPMFDPFEGEDPVDEALVSLTITEGEVVDSKIVFQDGRVKETQTELLTSGTVELASDGRIYDLGDCSGSRFEARGIITNAAGPKETGRPPANDVPSGAVPVDVGDSVNQQTKATVFDPEAPCAVFDEEEPIDIIGKTVWYSIEGSGGVVTLSTAGSNFDTVLAVYDSSDLTEPLECVDDVFEDGFSLQAELTLQTESGVTYLVQIGGFAGEYGLMKLSTSG